MIMQDNQYFEAPMPSYNTQNTLSSVVEGVGEHNNSQEENKQNNVQSSSTLQSQGRQVQK